MGLPRLSSTRAWLCCGLYAAAACSSTADAPAPGSAHVALERSEDGCDASAVFDAGERIETYDSSGGDFRVHFTRAGRDAVPVQDSDGDGTPDFVRQVADEFDAVLAFYRDLGYRTPLHAGEDRFSVYLVDFPTSADGQYCHTHCDADSCSGFMLLENDFVGRRYASTDAAIRLLASHELFHGVQAAYTPQASLVLSEGTAVWASEAFDDTAGDLESQVPGYLTQPENPLGRDPAGTFDGFSYGSSLFFEYLDEAVDRAVVRELWEAMAEGPREPDAWPAALEGVLQARDTSLATHFARFAEWNLFTGSRADATRAYRSGAQFPEVTEVAVAGFLYDKSVRVYPLAARYYALQSDRDQRVFARATPASGSDATGLALLVAREHAGRIADLEKAAAPDALTLQLDLERGDTLHAVLFNTHYEGESIRPSLCLGAGDDLAKCAETPAPADAGTEADHSHDDNHDDNHDDGGCSVRRPASDASSLPAASLALLAALTLRRRTRTTRGRRRAPPSGT